MVCEDTHEEGGDLQVLGQSTVDYCFLSISESFFFRFLPLLPIMGKIWPLTSLVI